MPTFPACTIVAAVEQLESDLIREWVSAGVRNARAKGRQFDRARRIVSQDELVWLKAAGFSLRQIAAKLGVGHSTASAIYRPSSSICLYREIAPPALKGAYKRK